MTTTDTLAPSDPTVAWAEEHGTKFVFTAALDNYEPPRNYCNDHGWFYGDPTRAADWEGIILADATYFRDYRSSIYLVDDGISVRTFYVAGWSTVCNHVILHPFPLDNGPVSMSGWMLGPRTCHHLKVRVA